MTSPTVPSTVSADAVAVRREPPNHDTTTCYVNYQCRRPECVDRYNTNERERRRLHRAGQYRRYTDAAPVREHVLQFVAAGASPRAIALRAEVSYNAVRDLLPVGACGARRPFKHRMFVETAAKLLALAPEDVVPQHVLALGTCRRLQAHVADGWPMIVLATWVDLYPGYVSALIGRASLYDNAQVFGSTALRVARAYDQLRKKKPARNGVSHKGSAYARTIARSRNWPPTRYWDEFPGAIDDPHFIPEYGKTRRMVVAENAHWLMTKGGLDRGRAAERLGVDRSYLDHAFRTHPEYAPREAA